MKKQVLVIVDVQLDFEPHGALPVTDGDKVVPVINNLLKDKKWDHVIATQDWHPRNHISFASNHTGKNVFDVVDVNYGVQVLWPDHCIQGTHGADFDPALDANKIDLIIRKGADTHVDSYSGLKDAAGKPTVGYGWAKQLFVDGDVDVYFTGLATDYCVLNTAIDFVELSKEVRNFAGGKTNFFLVKDAVKGVAPDTTAVAIQKMIDAGITLV